MALEPLSATATEDNAELQDMTRRFRVSLVLALPLLAITMSDFIPGLDLHHLLNEDAFNWIQAALASPVVLWGGWPFFVRAWTSFKTWNLDMFSLVGLLFPTLLPDAFKMDGMVPLYFEAAAVIVALVLMGQVLELRARSQTNSAIKSLLAPAPNTAVRVRSDGGEEEVHLDEVHVGDILRVKSGTKVPVDGEVTEGRSNIDESMITGEPIPAEKHPGSKVTAGTVNQFGSFLLRAEKVGAETLLAQIVRMVNEASRSRAPIQKPADQVSG